MDKKILGILGGMGPQATIDLQQQILDWTRAEKDQQHMRVIVDDHPQIPDRIGAVFANTVSPVPAMLESALNLQRCGAGCIVIPCITAHYFLPELKRHIDTPFLDMPSVAAQACLDSFPGKVAGILCSSVTTKMRLFADKLLEAGVDIVELEGEDQELVSRLILDIKAKADRDTVWQKLWPVIQRMQARGADYFVLACTELPIVARGRDQVPFVDATQALALAAIRYCGYKTVE